MDMISLDAESLRALAADLNVLHKYLSLDELIHLEDFLQAQPSLGGFFAMLTEHTRWYTPDLLQGCINTVELFLASHERRQHPYRQPFPYARPSSAANTTRIICWPALRSSKPAELPIDQCRGGSVPLQPARSRGAFPRYRLA